MLRNVLEDEDKQWSRWRWESEFGEFAKFPNFLSTNTTKLELTELVKKQLPSEPA